MNRRMRDVLARVLNVPRQVYQAQIHECAVESALPFGSRRKVGFPAIIQQTGAGRKYRIKRQARPLQSYGSKKSDVEVRAPPNERRGRDIQTLYRIECAK